MVLITKVLLYTFASDHVFQQLAAKYNNQMLAGAVGMFNAGAAGESYGAVSAGKLFEKPCLWLKKIDCISFTAQALKPGVAPVNFVVPSNRELLQHDWKKNGSLQPGYLYVPRISNLESGDSFYVVEISTLVYALVVLQITVGQEHPVKVNDCTIYC